MTTDIQIKIAAQILATGLVTKVYHSCELIRDGDQKTLNPAYKVGADYLIVGIDDQQGLFSYIRANGEITSVPLKLTSCRGAYEVTAPLRVVFYHDREERDEGWLLKRLATFTFLQDVTLQRVVVDKFRLAREESDVQDPNFDGQVFYVAFDVLVNAILLPSDCAEAACPVRINPMCQS